MGTRSIVLVKGTKNNKTVVHRLYKHWGGYPTDNLKMIGNAIKESKNSIDKFVKSCEKYYNRDDMLEATSHSDTLDMDILGHQWDLEWIYTVDLDAKHVKVYGGGFSGEAPQVAYKKGPVNPTSYVNALIEEYQSEERKSILGEIYNLRTLGYKVNPKKKRSKQ